MADDEVQKLAGNLSDLNKVTLDAGIGFQGMTKKLIKMSDATSRAGKKWTIFSRVVSGSPIWKIQNKVRAFIDVLAQVEQSAQANAKAAKEQEQRVIDSVKAYESLKKPLEDAIKLREKDARYALRFSSKNKQLREAIKGTHAYNKARLEGVDVDKSMLKGLDEIIKKGKQQQNQFMAARKQAKFVKDMETAKGRAKISKDISRQVDEIKNRPRPQIKQGIAKTYLNATIKLDSLVQDIKKNGLIDAMGSTFGLISRAIKRSEKLQKLRIRVMLMLLVAFGVIKPVFSYLFKVLIIMMIVMGAIMIAAKVLYDTFDLMEDLPFFFALVKVVAGAILENLMLIFGMIGALLSGDMYAFIDYALDFVDNLLIIGLGLLGIALYGLLGLASGILYSLMDTVFRYVSGLFGGENAEFSKTVNDILLRGLMIFAAVYAVKQLAIMMLHVALTKGIYLLLPAMILVAVIAGVKFLYKTLKSKLPFFANGGVSAGGMAVVGERGPELVSLPKGARVHSNSQSKKMSSSVVNNNVSVTINAKDTSDAELRRIADQVGNMIANKMNRSVSSSGFVR